MRDMRTAFPPMLRACLGLAALAGAWAERRLSTGAAGWYRGLTRALLGAPQDGDAAELARADRWVRTEVVLLTAAGAALVASAVLALL